MQTEKQKIKNSIDITIRLISISKEFLNILNRSRNHKIQQNTQIKEETKQNIIYLQTRLIYFETRLGILVEKGRLG